MNARERVNYRLRGERVDRPPNFNIYIRFAAHHAGHPMRRFLLDHRALVEASLRMVEGFGIDLVQTISDPYREASGFGAEIEFPEDGLPLCRRPLLGKPTGLSGLPRPDPSTVPRMLDRLEAVRLLREKAGSEVPVMGWVEGALSVAAVLRGDANLLLDLVDRPGWVHELLEKCAEVEIAFARAQVEAGAHIIGLGDALASQVSPQMYSTFVLPYEKRIVDAVHSLGAHARLHICGNTSRLLPAMVTSGADIIDLDWMVDWTASRAAYGDRVSLCGNIDPVALLLQGSPEMVYEATLKCLRAGGAKSFCAAGCEIPEGTPHANLRAQARALEEWEPDLGGGGGATDC